MAIVAATEHLGYPYKLGVVGDMASLGPEREDGYRRFLGKRTREMRQLLFETGVIDGTGEAATMLVQCSIYGFRAGVVNVNSLDKVNQRWDPEMDDRVVQVGLEAMRILASWDQTKQAQNRKYITPEIL